jgi:F-type H+-transporting ATPase subunit epsilon
MMNCRIWAGGTSIFIGPAHGILVPGSEGELGILPGHISLTTTLISGIVRIFYEKKSVSIEVSGGVFLVEGDQVTLWTSCASILDTIEESMEHWIPVKS